ncbi:MAG: hypothetical protein JGK21_05225 [Microcoleus sp. PH2017_22_RUC_O_B]|uniref:hypothetical protein n=1 Tax=unclassified Microcoleus TaxID=2642155 RepID=UPI001D927809|nr:MULTISPECIES: hypothetical protein [unclassified Microcoleus]MCC3527682.1 hypothetical protein [Microcoleus sp. PH2017_21_RUC_O_A]MCC3539784.1 hypothetical protein [Microcoleus sp. PH2017_22_RUC_O_B]
MSFKIFIEQNKDIRPAGVELLTIGGDILNPTFSGISDSNARLSDAKALVKACANHIKEKVTLSVMPSVFFIYRGVAVGGLQRKLGGFASKPLTVKDKSIDPSIIVVNEDFKRLTGLVPIQKKLGKNGDPTDNSLISLTPQQQSYRIVKIEDVGNTKSYLCCRNTDRTLSWENTMTPTGKTLCTFLGDTSNPYLADWDLVLVGVTKRSIRQDKIREFEVVKKEQNILPQWLFDCLNNQTVPLSSHVTQHGPESLYGGNDITQPNEEFIVLTNTGSDSSNVSHKVINKSETNIVGTTPWDKVKTYVGSNFSDYFLYQFENFSGTGNNKPNNYDEAIKKLNQNLLNSISL